MKGKIWRPEEIKELKELIDKGYTKKKLAEHFDRTENGIVIKVNRCGWQIINTKGNKGNKGRTWRDNEAEELITLWTEGETSLTNICKKLRRSKFAVRSKATKLKLGKLGRDYSYLTVPEICSEMQVSKDRVYRWIEKGLVANRFKTNKLMYCITEENLLEYLKNHPNDYDASIISSYLFYEEPDWLIAKRKSDKGKFAANSKIEYTNEEDKIIMGMFRNGVSDIDISKHLNRSECGIACHRRALSLYKGEWTDREIKILRDNADYLTVDEISKLLPGRTKSGVCYIANKLRIPIHTSKNRCKERS